MSPSAAVAVGTLAGVSVLSALARPRVPARVALLRNERRQPEPRPFHRRARPTFAMPLLIGALFGFIAGPIAGAIACVGILLRRHLAERRRQRRTSEAIASALPDFVDMLVLTIKSGRSPLQAFVALEPVAPAPVRHAVQNVCHRTMAGDRFADAVSHLRDPPPIGVGPLGQSLADALGLADRHGTALPPVLDRLAHEAREHRRRQADIAVRQLPVRLAFPLVGCTLPSFVLLTIVPLMAGTFSSLRGLTP